MELKDLIYVRLNYRILHFNYWSITGQNLKKAVQNGRWGRGNEMWRSDFAIFALMISAGVYLGPEVIIWFCLRDAVVSWSLRDLSPFTTSLFWAPSCKRENLSILFIGFMNGTAWSRVNEIEKTSCLFIPLFLPFLSCFDWDKLYIILCDSTAICQHWFYIY